MKTTPAGDRHPPACLLQWLAGLSGLAFVMFLPPGCAKTQSAGFVVRSVYPATMRQSKSLDIQVFRDNTKITFTNASAQAIPECTMWINAWYSRPLPPLAIGQTMQISLFDFKDQYGDVFRAGGFFASQRPTRIVLAQLQTDDHLLGLVVVGEQE